MPTPDRFAFISLLPDQDEAQELVDELVVMRAEAAEDTALLIVPPVRGLEFFANDDVQDALQAWWKQFVPGGAKIVFLMRHEEGLAAWLSGVEGTMIVAIGGNADPSDYEGIDGVTVVQGRSVDTLVEAVTEVWPALFPTDDVARADDEQRLLEQLMHFSSIGENDFAAGFEEGPEEGGKENAEEDGESGEVEAEEPSEPTGRPSGGGGPRRQGAGPGGKKTPQMPLSWGQKERGGPSAKAPPVKEPDPPRAENPWLLFLDNPQLAKRHAEVEAEMFAGVGTGPVTSKANPLRDRNPGEIKLTKPAPLPPAKTGSGIRLPNLPKIDLGSLFAGLRPGKSRGGTGIGVLPEELAHLVTARGNLIVVVASRKGGVGKTTHAAAMALVSSIIAGSIGGQAAFVDFNVTNPDAWGQLGLPEGATTVRRTIAALVAGVPIDELPIPAWAKDSKLACYPSDRSPAGYSQTEIDRFAEHLKRRYKIVVIDLANHMPEIGDPAGEAVAFWLEHADVLVLPTMASSASFIGVLDYLDLPDLPPAVVAYIVSPLKKTQNHPMNKSFLAEIRDKVFKIVEFPFSSEVDYADYEETPITELTPELSRAYWRLTEAVIKAPPRQNMGDDDDWK